MKDPLLYLTHIETSCERIIEYTTNSQGSWLGSQMAMDAICRNLEIIGEAANKLGSDYHRDHPEIAWRGMIGARNILIHAYDIVNPNLLLDMVAKDIPELLKWVRAEIVQMRSETNR